MSENVEPIVSESSQADADEKRQRSTIAFPYVDYETVLELAKAIHANVGHGGCTAAQLAAWTNQSPKSSGFRTQISAARMFGAIESGDSENLRLTDIGRRIVDTTQDRAAKAEAFLRVPLFKALFDKYKDGGLTPPSAAIEREIAALGVSEKQKAKARQVFESSAQQTGFRAAGANRLVMPAVVTKETLPPLEDKTKIIKNGGGGSDGEKFDLDPLLMALLRKIPKGDAGWPAENRLRWFRTFAMNVSQVYDDDNNPVELEIQVKSAEKTTP